METIALSIIFGFPVIAAILITKLVSTLKKQQYENIN